MLRPALFCAPTQQKNTTVLRHLSDDHDRSRSFAFFFTIIVYRNLNRARYHLLCIYHNYITVTLPLTIPQTLTTTIRFTVTIYCNPFHEENSSVSLYQPFTIIILL